MKKFGMVIAIGREVKGVLEAFGKVEKIENLRKILYFIIELVIIDWYQG